jgi:xanthine dehydrogenase YagS FAD-binding subunit
VREFAYARATDTAGAIAALGEPGAKLLAGGTNLVDLMKLGVETPRTLVDVRHIGNDRIEPTEDGGLRIGAAVTNSDLAADATVRARYPVLARALLAGASGQIRNQATVAGNLLQRTRCSYFQDVTKPCNKRDPGSGCPARGGAHRELAILGHSSACIATHPGDMAVALTALDATVHVAGPNGERVIGMPGFHRLPGDEPQRDTNLDAGELITAVELPPLPETARSDYRKARDRASFAFGLVTVAATLDHDGSTIRRATVALGAVAHVPWRATLAEEALAGQEASGASFAEAADAELAQAEPLRDNAFKVTLARNLIVALLTDLAARR